jgi:hypothetical protein
MSYGRDLVFASKQPFDLQKTKSEQMTERLKDL